MNLSALPSVAPTPASAEASAPAGSQLAGVAAPAAEGASPFTSLLQALASGVSGARQAPLPGEAIGEGEGGAASTAEPAQEQAGQGELPLAVALQALGAQLPLPAHAAFAASAPPSGGHGGGSGASLEGLGGDGRAVAALAPTQPGWARFLVETVSGVDAAPAEGAPELARSSSVLQGSGLQPVAPAPPGAPGGPAYPGQGASPPAQLAAPSGDSQLAWSSSGPGEALAPLEGAWEAVSPADPPSLEGVAAEVPLETLEPLTTSLSEGPVQVEEGRAPGEDATKPPALEARPAETERQAPAELRASREPLARPVPLRELAEVARVRVQRALTEEGSRPRTIEIQLDPPRLGKVRIEITADEGGAVRARIHVDSARVQGLLEQQGPALQGRLAEAGVELQELVLTSGFGSEPHPREEPQRPEGSAGPRPQDEPSPAELEQVPAERPGLINLRA